MYAERPARRQLRTVWVRARCTVVLLTDSWPGDHGVGAWILDRGKLNLVRCDPRKAAAAAAWASRPC
jgi:hypothetical protein